jgi:hypothetical protein
MEVKTTDLLYLTKIAVYDPVLKYHRETTANTPRYVGDPRVSMAQELLKEAARGYGALPDKREVSAALELADTFFKEALACGWMHEVPVPSPVPEDRDAEYDA